MVVIFLVPAFGHPFDGARFVVWGGAVDVGVLLGTWAVADAADADEIVG